MFPVAQWGQLQRGMPPVQSSVMRIRLTTHADVDSWTALRAALWPEEDTARLRDDVEAYFEGVIPVAMLAAVFLAEAPSGEIVGMLELSLRPYADGCDSSPVPYVEGWYVAEAYRRQGVGAALLKAAQDWARERDYTEMASDALLDNTDSERAHKALGFTEIERAIRFRKTLI
jgi:aminoglycoside 6'-N-acetyltransferase I